MKLKQGVAVHFQNQCFVGEFPDELLEQFKKSVNDEKIFENWVKKYKLEEENEPVKKKKSAKNVDTDSGS
jgi:ribosomal protein S21